jgi:hypothetical protein
MHSVEASALSERGFVSTVHVLKSGEIIYSLQDFMKIESRFSWVDKKYLVTKILELQKKTDDRRRSFLVIYEDGNRYVNTLIWTMNISAASLLLTFTFRFSSSSLTSSSSDLFEQSFV